MATPAEQESSKTLRKYLRFFPQDHAREYESELIYEEKHGKERKDKAKQKEIWNALFREWLDFQIKYQEAFPNGPAAIPVWDRAQIMRDHGLDKKGFVEFVVYLKREFWGSVASWEAMDGYPADINMRAAAAAIQSSIHNVKKT